VPPFECVSRIRRIRRVGLLTVVCPTALFVSLCASFVWRNRLPGWGRPFPVVVLVVTFAAVWGWPGGYLAANCSHWK